MPLPRYYVLDQFNQNHARLVKSASIPQFYSGTCMAPDGLGEPTCSGDVRPPTSSNYEKAARQLWHPKYAARLWDCRCTLRDMR